MPTVPTAPVRESSSIPKPSDANVLMAIADMQAKGQLPHNIEDGPEYDKWDEALQQHGAIRLPKERDNPQEWLSKDHIKNMLEKNNIDRQDNPDGSVILRKRVPTS